AWTTCTYVSCACAPRPCYRPPRRTTGRCWSSSKASDRRPGTALAFSSAPDHYWRNRHMGIIAWLVVGLIAGWLGGMLTGHTRGLLGNIVLGILGGLLGGFVGSAMFGWDM